MYLNNTAIVLVEPQIPENIGAAARAMCNMGLNRLILISPKNEDPERIKKMATGDSAAVIESMKIYSDFLEATGDFNFLVGTTARLGNNRPFNITPRGLAEKLKEITLNNQVAIIFGREDRGLSNEHLRHCHLNMTIPTADFSSMNLAHAVLLVCYELFAASSGDLLEKKHQTPRLANTFELEGMYGHLERTLIKIGFINPQNPEHWIMNIRHFLTRFPLRAREVRVVRGICRQIEWYENHLQKNK